MLIFFNLEFAGKARVLTDPPPPPPPVLRFPNLFRPMKLVNHQSNQIRWRIVADGEYIWAVCFIPGVLGVLLSLNSCRKSHRRCKPLADDDAARAEQRPRRSSPHVCALPAHTLLLLSVVACLGMHSFAMLFCEVSDRSESRDVRTCGGGVDEVLFCQA